MEIDLFHDGQCTEYYGSVTIEERDAIVEELMSGSDRAAIITGQALLESAVTNAIWSLFSRRDKHAKEIVGDEDSPGELSFYYQCKLLYAMGLIGPHTLSDFLAIAKMRNKFGHRYRPMAFSSDDIKNACNSLWTPDHSQNIPADLTHLKSLLDKWQDQAKARFIFTIWVALHVLTGEILNRPEPFLSYIPKWLK